MPAKAKDEQLSDVEAERIRVTGAITAQLVTVAEYRFKDADALDAFKADAANIAAKAAGVPPAFARQVINGEFGIAARRKP